VVFTENLRNASFGGRHGRHEDALSFIANPKSDVEVASVRDIPDGFKYSLHPAESYINNDSTPLKRMVSRLVEWGFET